MALLTRTLLPFLLGRISGSDGHYTAFRLAFYRGTVPLTITDPPPSGVLAQFDFLSPWASTSSGTHIAKPGPLTASVIASGVPTFWRLLGIHAGAWSSIVQGSIGLVGSNADIKVHNLEWLVGDPLTLHVIRIYPIKLSYS